ncbi:TIGR03943 family putative permease subunit [Paenibacillus tarimensis]|uniref:TIGR03943 family putative permease subunit n=1 Tax=Paenibacillus tarimensis TaxID=416012 RepID=UPI001F44E852|nr:TIGR03943 family protein [Paenibacillus tarimensis]MCF2943742.1 TIGR03943 family protein [Paenibacillus tarimensis]
MQDEIRSRMLHQLMRGLILTGFAMLIVYLVKTDSIGYYIAPRMELYVKLSAIGLYAAAVYQFYEAIQSWIGRKREAQCDCSHDPSPSAAKNTLIYGLFLFPLALGFLLPDTTMGSALASKKGITLSSSQQLGGSADTVTSANEQSQAEVSPESEGSDASASQPEMTSPVPIQLEPGAVPTEEQLNAMFPADTYTETYAEHAKKLYFSERIEIPEKSFIEYLTTLDLYRANLTGKTVVISGFVYREEEMGKDRFVVSRFAMNCCSADAMPYGLMIDYPGASRYADDEWIQVTGRMELTTYKDNEIVYLKASKIEKIAAPETPYVYPDFDFGF